MTASSVASRFCSLPVARGLTLACALSLGVAALAAAVSAAALALGSAGLYGDPMAAAVIVLSTAGVLVPWMRSNARRGRPSLS